MEVKNYSKLMEMKIKIPKRIQAFLLPENQSIYHHENMPI